MLLAGTSQFGDFARFEISDSTFDRNEAFLPGYGDGGAIYLRSGQLAIRRSTITGSFAGDEGGAIYHRSGGTLIEDSTIAANRSASWGGALPASAVSAASKTRPRHSSRSGAARSVETLRTRAVSTRWHRAGGSSCFASRL